MVRRWLTTLIKRDTGGERPPLVSGWQAGRPITSDWSTERAIQHGLKASVWVYAAVRRIATNVSRVPWHVEVLQAGGTWQRDPSHPLAVLLNEPNPFMTGQDLRERWVYHLWLGGNALGKLVLVRGTPVEIWPLSPDRVKPVPDPSRFLSHYEYRDPSGQVHAFPPEEVIHLQFVDPANPYWGLSPLQAAAKVVDTDTAAVHWNLTALQNRTVKDLIYFPSQPLTREQWEEARRMLREQHMGPDNARGIFLASMPGEIQEVGTTATELDWLNSRRLTREEIAAAMGIPLVVLTGEGTYRNFETAVRMVWQDVFLPFLDDLAEAFNAVLVPYWDPEARQPGAPPKLRVVYDISSVTALQEDFGTKVEIAERLVRLGYTLNQVNQRLGLGFDNVPWGDQPSLGPTVMLATGPRSFKADLASEWPEERKAAFWRQRDTARRRWERYLADRIAQQFLAEGQVVARAFARGGEAAAYAAIDAAATEWRAFLEAAYLATIEHWGREEFERLQAQAVKAAPAARKFRALSDRIKTWASRYAALKVSYLTEATRRAIGAAITEGLLANEDTREIARRIRETYERWAEPPDDSEIDVPRSYRIARTEAGSAMNFAVQEAGRQARDEFQMTIVKTWISSRDDRVRESHRQLDGETVGLEDRFSNGLLYPLDPDATDASEVVNCRCVVAQSIVR